MTTKNMLMASVAIATAFLLLPSGAAGTANEDSDYTNGPLGDATWQAPNCDPLLAQACFTATQDGLLTISITDASTLPVSFYLDGVGSGCGELEIAVTAGQEVHVTANGPAFAALDCGATTATVGTFNFSM